MINLLQLRARLIVGTVIVGVVAGMMTSHANIGLSMPDLIEPGIAIELDHLRERSEQAEKSDIGWRDAASALLGVGGGYLYEHYRDSDSRGESRDNHNGGNSSDRSE